MRLLIGSLMLVVLAGFAFGQSASPSDEKEIMALEDTYLKATNNKDEASLAIVEKHTLDPFTYIDVFGKITTKSVKDLMTELRRSDPGVTETQRQSDYQVRVIGKTAVVTYHSLYSASGMKKEIFNVADAPASCMDVFVKKGKEWYGWSTSCASRKSIPQDVYDAMAEEKK